MERKLLKKRKILQNRRFSWLSAYEIYAIICEVINEKDRKETYMRYINELREAKKRKIAYYENDVLIEIFDSCVEAAEYFKITPKLFNYYIGKKRVQKSKYFSKTSKLEYYE